MLGCGTASAPSCRFCWASGAPAHAHAQRVRDRLLRLPARASRDFFRLSTLGLICLGLICVRLCAPDALHLVWDSGTIEIVFGVVFPLTCVHGWGSGNAHVVSSVAAAAVKWDALRLRALSRHAKQRGLSATRVAARPDARNCLSLSFIAMPSARASRAESVRRT